MLCERCHKKEATVHYVQIVNGQKTESHLCAACAGRENLMTRAGTFRGMENFMGSVFEDPFFRSVAFLSRMRNDAGYIPGKRRAGLSGLL